MNAITNKSAARHFYRLMIGLYAFVPMTLSAAYAQQTVGDRGAGRVVARRLTVTGHGEVIIASDKADITIGVVTEDASSKGAVTANAVASQKVQDAMARMGVARKDIQTLQYNVQPISSSPPLRPEATPHPPSIVAYRVSNQVRVTVRDLSKIGELLDEATAAGSNTIENIVFGREDQAAYEDAALRKAVTDARRKADLMSKTAGAQITGIIEMNEGEIRRPSPILYSRAAFASDNASTPIQPGEVTVSANVTIVYEMGDTIRAVSH